MRKMTHINSATLSLSLSLTHTHTHTHTHTADSMKPQQWRLYGVMKAAVKTNTGLCYGMRVRPLLSRKSRAAGS